MKIIRLTKLKKNNLTTYYLNLLKSPTNGDCIRVDIYLCYVQVFAQFLCKILQNSMDVQPVCYYELLSLQITGFCIQLKVRISFESLRVLRNTFRPFMSVFCFIKLNARFLNQIILNLIKNRLHVQTFNQHLFTEQRKTEYPLLDTDRM